MQDFSHDDLNAVVDGILSNEQSTLENIINPGDLESFWYFKYNPANTVEYNLYSFMDMLWLYQRKCRAWETMHHGSACVVERVRDRYIMPKILEFVETIRAAGPNHVIIPNSVAEAKAMVLIGQNYIKHYSSS
jgi:hypothetical protein